MDFAFLNETSDELIFSDEINILEAPNDEFFLVANSPKIKAEIYAPEINNYLANSKNSMLEKAKNVKILYESRALSFDFATNLPNSQNVGKNVIYMSQTPRKTVVETLQKAGFKVITCKNDEVESVYGKIGEIYVQITQDVETECDFFICENTDKKFLTQSGCYEISNLDENEILELLSKKTPVYKYENFVSYNHKICDFDGSKTECCGLCADVCPTVAILKDKENAKLNFSHIDCVKCAKCVQICPSGALEIAKMSIESFEKIAKLYKDRFVILLSEKNLPQNITLPENALYFVIPNDKFLKANHFLSILEQSGQNMIFFTPYLDEITKQNINFVNKIYDLKFHKTAIITIENENELQSALNKTEKTAYFDIPFVNQSSREILSQRLGILVENENFGKISLDEHPKFAQISINEDTCTLCASCAGACKNGALIADSEENAIKLNASLCTACGACVKSCAEQGTIAIQTNEIDLQKSFFEYQTLAHDELFACIECGKKFATKKSIMRVTGLLKDSFTGDTYKMKSLFCCSDCKAKLMIQKQLKEQNGN